MKEPIEIFKDIRLTHFANLVCRTLLVGSEMGLIEFDNKMSSYTKLYGKHKGRARFFGMYNRNNLDVLICRHPYQKTKTICIELPFDELIKHGAIEKQ